MLNKTTVVIEQAEKVRDKLAEIAALVGPSTDLLLAEVNEAFDNYRIVLLNTNDKVEMQIAMDAFREIRDEAARQWFRD